MSEETINQPQTNTEETSAEKINNPNNDDSLNETTNESKNNTNEIVETKLDDSKINEHSTNEETKVETPTDINQATEILNQKGFNYDKLQEEYNQYGDITEETRKQLAEKGINKEILDNYINGQKAIVAQQMNEIAESVGGKEQFETIVNWAKENLTADEKKQIDEIHDPIAIKYIVAGLKTRMESAEGVIPQQLQGEGGKTPTNLFADMSEVQAAIKDPRYEVSESYREQVAKKITASRQAGNIQL